jgi:hypothetical protein
MQSTRRKRHKTQYVAQDPDIIADNAKIESDKARDKTRYDLLHSVYRQERAKRFGAVVEDDGTHECNLNCNMTNVLGVAFVLPDLSEHICMGERYCSAPSAYHEKPRFQLRDLYICENTMCAHICHPDWCKHSVQSSEGIKCNLTGRFGSIEPAYTQGWQDDPWRAPCPREQKLNTANEDSKEMTLRQLAVLLKNPDATQVRTDVINSVCMKVSEIMPYGQRRLKWQECKQLKRYSMTTTSISRYVNAQERENLPVFLDEVATICRHNEIEESAILGFVDENSIDALVLKYVSSCLDYILLLMYQTSFWESENRVDDTVISLLYLRCSKLKANGVTIFAAEPILRCLLPKAHALSFIFERSMGCFTNSLAQTRAVISTAASSITSSDLQFPLYDIPDNLSIVSRT